MRVFIFGIGGTGARVLRSFAMLIAGGIKINQNSLEVIPVIIDMDAHNGDTARTRDLLRNYYSIRGTFLSPTAPSQEDTFFNVRFRPFNRLDPDQADAASLDVQFDFQNRDNTFANFINYDGLNQVNKDLIELLYNDSLDDNPELHLNLSVGFKGNPNIGSVVFNDLKHAQQFKNFEGSFTGEDRVFIISSIFGGTGSSGFPTLTKLIRNSTNNNLAKAKIGAITVMPYFNVDTDEKSAINSSIFDTKTKSALSFYSGDKDINSINALYYIADNNQSGTLPNAEGGASQINPSHMVELLSATAIVDFVNKSDNELSTHSSYEFGAEHDDNPFTINKFNGITKERYIKPLIRMAYAAKIATEFIPQLKDNAFYKPQELNIAGALGMPNEYKKLLDFFEDFKRWSSEELGNADNGRVLKLFNYTDNKHLNTLVNGKSIETGWLKSGLTVKKIGEKLTKINNNAPKDIPVPEKYLKVLFKTADECLDDLGQLP